MLVLQRHEDQQIVIGGFGELFRRTEDGQFVPLEPVVITNVKTRGDYCRIGIHCDKAVSVHRSEVLNRLTKGAEQ